MSHFNPLSFHALSFANSHFTGCKPFYSANFCNTLNQHQGEIHFGFRELRTCKRFRLDILKLMRSDDDDGQLSRVLSGQWASYVIFFRNGHMVFTNPKARHMMVLKNCIVDARFLVLQLFATTCSPLLLL